MSRLFISSSLPSPLTYSVNGGWYCQWCTREIDHCVIDELWCVKWVCGYMSTFGHRISLMVVRRRYRWYGEVWNATDESLCKWHVHHMSYNTVGFDYKYLYIPLDVLVKLLVSFIHAGQLDNYIGSNYLFDNLPHSLECLINSKWRKKSHRYH